MQINRAAAVLTRLHCVFKIFAQRGTEIRMCAVFYNIHCTVDRIEAAQIRHPLLRNQRMNLMNRMDNMADTRNDTRECPVLCNELCYEYGKPSILAIIVRVADAVRQP